MPYFCNRVRAKRIGFTPIAPISRVRPLSKTSDLVNYLLAISPILCYMLLMLSLDTFRLCRRLRLFGAAAYGVASALAAWALTSAGGPWTASAGVVVLALLEEGLKGGLLIGMAGRRHIGFFAEGIIYGATVGAGFALVENLLYITADPQMRWLEALLRGFSTALLHIGCTALVGAGCVMVVRELKDKRNLSAWWVLSLCLLPSAAIHALHNMMLVHPFVQMLILVPSFLLLLFALNAYDSRLIDRWMERMMEGELTLLSHVQQGTLAETHAGRYLMALQGSFSAEEIADLTACLSIHLRLAVAAKCRLMLIEAQMASPIPPEQQQRYAEELEELKVASQRIGPRGRMALRHIVTIDAFDQHVHNILLKK